MEPDLKEFDAYYIDKSFTTDWTSLNFPIWKVVLHPLREKPVRILEIGSWEGRSALFFLNFLSHSSIVCVDTFAGAHEHRSWSFWRRFRQLKRIEERFDRNLAPFGTRLEKRKENSLDALGQLGLERRAFELIYIDGSHAPIDVYRDGLLAWPLLTSQGLLIFDDYLKTRSGDQIWPELQWTRRGIRRIPRNNQSS